MNNHKKLLKPFLLIICAITAFAFSACGGNTESNTDNPPPAEEELTVTVGLTYKRNDDGNTCSCTGLGSVKSDIIVINSEYDGRPVTEIAAMAFGGCKNITRVVIPDSVTTIGKSAFFGCNSLSQITFPDGLTTIGEYAFMNCPALTEITLPVSLTYIDRLAFTSVSEKDITFKGTKAQWQSVEKDADLISGVHCTDGDS